MACEAQGRVTAPTQRDHIIPLSEGGADDDSNVQALWAHCSTKLHWLVREHPFRSARLADEDLSVDFSALTTPSDRVAVIVTEPLTADERWNPLAPGELAVFRDGARMI